MHGPSNHISVPIRVAVVDITYSPANEESMAVGYYRVGLCVEGCLSCRDEVGVAWISRVVGLLDEVSPLVHGVNVGAHWFCWSGKRALTPLMDPVHFYIDLGNRAKLIQQAQEDYKNGNAQKCSCGN